MSLAAHHAHLQRAFPRLTVIDTVSLFHFH
jgi:hypothetical protein